jgi:hypothetical protein
MRSKVNGVVGLVLGGVLVAGMVGAASCSDSSSSGSNAGAGGSSTGGAGGNGADTSIYDMMMTGAQEAPPNDSAAGGSVRVTLNRTTGAVTVTGTFANLSSPATAAHIHGPAGIGMTAPPLMTLTVSPATLGDITGAGTMDSLQMNDMIAAQTYVNIESVNFPGGEIRAQITPGIVGQQRP